MASAPFGADSADHDGRILRLWRSHGYRWVSRENMTAQEEEQSIRDAIQAICKTAGKAPRGWYWGNVATPGSSRSRALVAKVFKEEGLPLCWYSDSYADDLPYW